MKSVDLVEYLSSMLEAKTCSTLFHPMRWFLLQHQVIWYVTKYLPNLSSSVHSVPKDPPKLTRNGNISVCHQTFAFCGLSRLRCSLVTKLIIRFHLVGNT